MSTLLGLACPQGHLYPRCPHHDDVTVISAYLKGSDFLQIGVLG